MSEICIGIINGMPDGEALAQMEKEVLQYCHDVDIEFSRKLQYVEAFIPLEAIRGSAVFELTQDGVAEMLLSPDWCICNFRENKGTLQERLQKIENALQLILRFVSSSIDLYIGDSGGEQEDYARVDVLCSEVSTRLVELYEACGRVPKVCLHIAKK